MELENYSSQYRYHSSHPVCSLPSSLGTRLTGPAGPLLLGQPLSGDPEELAQVVVIYSLLADLTGQSLQAFSPQTQPDWFALLALEVHPLCKYSLHICQCSHVPLQVLVTSRTSLHPTDPLKGRIPLARGKVNYKMFVSEVK